MTSRKEPTPKKPESSKAEKAKRAARRKARAAKAAKTQAQPQGVITAAQAQKERDEKQQAQEDVIIGKINWQWRKFALGIMNYLPAYKAYAEAYSIPNVDRDDRAYKVATASSARLLANVSFRKYWRELLEEQGFNDDMVDTQMLMQITDPETPHAVRRAAIRDYNELKGRIIKKQTMTDGQGKSLFDDDSTNFELKVVRANK